MPAGHVFTLTPHIACGLANNPDYCVQAIAFENEQTSKEPTQLRPEFLHQTSGEKKQGVDMRGYVWVS